MRQSLFVISLILILFGCKEEEPNLSEREILVDALINNDWKVDPMATNVSNVSGAPNKNTFTVKFYKNETGVDFVLGGDVSEYFTRGSFAIREEGALSDFDIFTPTPEITANITSVTATSEKVRLVIDTPIPCEEEICILGVATYTLVFVYSSTE